MPKVCGVLATYNGEQYLQKMLDSLVRQTLPLNTLIVVDDGSNDSTIEILERYKNKLPIQLTLSSENQGHCKAFAKGLELANQNTSPEDIIVLADQDDIWLPQKIKILVSQLNNLESEKTLIFSDANVIDKNDIEIHKSWRKYANISTEIPLKTRIAGTNNITGCLSAFRASLLKYILPFPQGINVHDAWIAMVASQKGNIIAIDDCLIQYRIHKNNAVGTKSPYNFDETCKRQVQWLELLLLQSHFLHFSPEYIQFAKKLKSYWKKRSHCFFLFSFLPMLIFNKVYLFPHCNRRVQKILFSLLGSRMVHLLFGKNK